MIKEGDLVKRGRVIAILQGIDRKQADLRDALTDIKLREIELEKVNNGNFKQAQIADRSAVINRLQAQLTSARKQREAALIVARSQLRNAEANYQRQAQADRNGIGLLTAQAKLANAEAEYRRRREFNRSGDNIQLGFVNLFAGGAILLPKHLQGDLFLINSDAINLHQSIFNLGDPSKEIAIVRFS